MKKSAQELFHSDAKLAAQVSDLITELDRMERDLGRWLASTGRSLARQLPDRCRAAGAPFGLPGPTWHALVLVWATSPDVRSRYSNEFRSGLLTAIESMDPPTLLPLVRGWLREGDQTGKDSGVVA